MLRLLKNANVSYSDNGQGQAIVLLNGLGRCAKHFLGFENNLAKYYRVITVDLRGSVPASRPCLWSMTVEDMAQDVIDVLDYLHIENAHIMGVSLGGMVAMACAINNPQRCKSLTLINSSIGQSHKRIARVTWHAVALLMKGIILRPDAEKMNETLTDLVVGIDCIAEERKSIARKLTDIFREHAPHPLNIVKQLLAAHRFRPADKLASLNIPTLVVYGTHDYFVPPLNSEIIASFIPKATLIGIKNGGHELMLDKASDVLETQITWIQLQAAC